VPTRPKPLLPKRFNLPSRFEDSVDSKQSVYDEFEVFENDRMGFSALAR